MARLDDRLTSELREVGSPADPAGVYEQLIRRRERRRLAERVRKAAVILVATMIAVAGIVLVVQAFGRPDRAAIPVESSVIEPHANGLIAFSRDATGGLELHTVEPDGSNERALPTPPGMPWLHAWSPDGDRIAVTIFPNAGGERSIWVMDADGSNPVPVAQADNVSVPSWSPDGTRIAYASEEGGRTEIHVVLADGSEDHVVHGEGAEGTFAIFSAKFSPDGTQLLFDRGTDSGFDIFVMRVDGSAVRRLTTTGTDYDPHWSPDGREIVFTRQGDGPRSDIYVMRADGSDVRQLTSGGDGETNLYPQWSPDGRSIAYLAGRGGGPGSLVVMGADGSDPRVLVEADRSGGVLGISWQPLPTRMRSSASTGPVGETPGVSRERDVPIELPGIGRVCGVTDLTGRFLGDGPTEAYVFEPEPEGGCDGPNEGFQFLGVADASGEVVVISDELQECLPVEGCWAFAAPDVDGDGRDEIAVATGHEYDAVWFSLYRVETCGPAADCVADRWLLRFEIVEPGEPHEGFPAGPVQFRWGGPPEDVSGVTCGRVGARPALINWYSATYDQWFLVRGSELDLASGDELDLTTLGLDELCGAPVAVEKPPSLTEP